MRLPRPSVRVSGTARAVRAQAKAIARALRTPNEMARGGADETTVGASGMTDPDAQEWIGFGMLDLSDANGFRLS